MDIHESLVKDYNPDGIRNERFRRTLDRYFRKIGLLPPNNPRILNVACGYACESKVLTDFFGGRLLGIDINEGALDFAQDEQGDDRHLFVQYDAADLTSLVQEVDIVVARHPHILADDWKQIYRQCFKATAEGGVIISTTYYRNEFKIARTQLEKAGYKIKAAEESAVPHSNKFSVFLGTDAFVLIGINEKGRLSSLVRRFLGQK